MNSIEKAVSNLNLFYLDADKYSLCYMCLVSGISFEDSLHHSEDMKEGISSSDKICPHCYDTDEEFGLGKLTKEESKNVFSEIKKFDEYRMKRLDSL